MAPFHFIFFGMMLSDAGYGLVLDDLALSCHEESKTPGIGRSARYGLPLWQYLNHYLGHFFGGWFGLEWHPLLFVPMNEPLKMLASALALASFIWRWGC